MSQKKAAIVLAAGKGTRMKSDLPKVLHQINGKPIIHFVIETLQSLKLDKIIVVIGYKGELVEESLKDFEVEFVWQREQLGTGHAVMMAKENLNDFEGSTLIALGDVPFLSSGTIKRLFTPLEDSETKAVCLSAILEEGGNYGRIVRDGDSDRMKAIVEAKDADDTILRINEINTGTFCFDNRTLFDTLEHIKNDNAQNEYYLTDCVKILFDNKMPVSVITCDDPAEGEGINSVEQLNQLAEKFKNRIKN